MELWLILTLIASVAGSISAFIDNYVTDVYFRGKTPAAQKVIGGPINLFVGLASLVVYSIISPNGYPPAFNTILFVASGIISSLATMFYYMALKSEDTTGAIIFCQLYPIFYLILGFLFLGEKIVGMQLIAFLFLIAAPVVILLLTGKRRKKMEYRAGLLLLINVILQPIAAIIFIFAGRDISWTNNEFSIVLAMGLMFIGKGIFDVVMSTLNKKWRRRAKRAIIESRMKIFVPFFINIVIWLFADYGIRKAMLAEQVAIVSAINLAVELLATFVLGLIFTIIWPRFGREKLDKRTVAAHFVATILAIIGIILVEKPDIFSGIW